MELDCHPPLQPISGNAASHHFNPELPRGTSHATEQPADLPFSPPGRSHRARWAMPPTISLADSVRIRPSRGGKNRFHPDSWLHNIHHRMQKSSSRLPCAQLHCENMKLTASAPTLGLFPGMLYGGVLALTAILCAGGGHGQAGCLFNSRLRRAGCVKGVPRSMPGQPFVSG